MTDHLARMKQSTQVVHVLKRADAQPLLDAKLVRRVSIQPPPKRGKVAVNLTVLGRSKS